MPGLTPRNFHTITPKFFASRIQTWCQVYGVPFTVYRPQESIDSSSGATTELPVIQVGSSIGLFMQEGAEKGEPTRVGVSPEQINALYYPAQDAFLVDQYDFVLDNAGNNYLVTSFPDRQRLGPTDNEIIGAHVGLIYQAERAEGQPVSPED